ncbi:hypothetical protein SAMN04487916_12131 [Arthrobacter sp. ov407]|uniref:hypothetical protein n=1 Tax=Arthrobacter sp. ov407 TaxID=1761748 RepID=UPI000880AF11|nr:hypothetical protein [Arthrobacter sp. ov407]SDM01363.1 hypothetical protein SAMN04487916_12131 [Arthrobacter sp. ov407]
MRVLHTSTDALNVTRIDRIAYLNAEERTFLTTTTGRPDFATPGQGEVIADMGRAVPVTLAYIDDPLEGSLIIARLTDLIANYDWPVIRFSDVREDARKEVAEIRYRESEDNAEPDRIDPHED